jgi:glycosyltransferase involved in cell wall biosynthesis
MSTVLAHHWLVEMRGGEKVLEQFCALFPDAPIYTLVASPERLSVALRKHRLDVSWFGRLPNAARLYQKALPFFPLIIGTHRVREDADLVLSSDASLIKGLRLRRRTRHVCYCHSPPRYLWDQQDTYAKAAGATMALLRAMTPALRGWDRSAADRVDHFIANSRFVQARIRAAYGRESTVIYPPVAVQNFIRASEPSDYYLIVSHLVPYKRVGLAVDAFNRLGRRLIVLGDGPELPELRRRAKSNVKVLGPQPFPVLREYYAHCRALIFPGVEDFGITPLEAQASGRPAIAFCAGGVLETVQDGKTGVLFSRQDVKSLIEGVERFESMEWDSNACQENAARFGEARFRREISGFLSSRGLPAGYLAPETDFAPQWADVAA